MLIAIENTRAGLIWKLFMRHTALLWAFHRLNLTLPNVQLELTRSQIQKTSYFYTPPQQTEEWNT